jgi:hypothetical protein
MLESIRHDREMWLGSEDWSCGLKLARVVGWKWVRILGSLRLWGWKEMGLGAVVERAVGSMFVCLVDWAVADMKVLAVKSSFHGFQLADLTTARFGGTGTLFPGY